MEASQTEDKSWSRLIRLCAPKVRAVPSQNAAELESRLSAIAYRRLGQNALNVSNHYARLKTVARKAGVVASSRSFLLLFQRSVCPIVAAWSDLPGRTSLLRCRDRFLQVAWTVSTDILLTSRLHLPSRFEISPSPEFRANPQLLGTPMLAEIYTNWTHLIVPDSTTIFRQGEAFIVAELLFIESERTAALQTSRLIENATAEIPVIAAAPRELWWWPRGARTDTRERPASAFLLEV